VSCRIAASFAAARSAGSEAGSLFATTSTRIRIFGPWMMHTT
jgi:hypothetical protein